MLGLGPDRLNISGYPVLFSPEKYPRHHTPDPSSSNPLDGVNIADHDLPHLLYLSPLAREKAGPAPVI